MSSKMRRWEWLALAAFGLGVTCLALYPGFINSDSQWQLEQARIGVYNNEHPPLMAFVWHYLNWVLPGGAGLFFFHALLFWIGLALIADELAADRRQAWLGCVVAVAFLPLLATFAVLVKDGGFAYALVLACGALLRAERSGSLAWIVASMAAVFYAVALRHNGLFAALPLTVWAGILLAPRWPSLARRVGERRCAAIIGAMLFVYQAVGAIFANRLLTSIEAYPAQMMLTWDLTGISVLSGRNYLPVALDWDRRPLTIDELKKVYTPDTNFYVLWGPPQPKPGWVFYDDDYRDLQSAWIRAVREQPAAYLSHRISAYVRLLGFRTRNGPYWFPPSTEVRADGSWNARFKAWLIKIVEDHPHFFLFKAWFYLAIVLVCLGFGWRKRIESRAFWSIGASSVLYEASYLFVSTSGDFRYSWWLLCAALLMPPMLLSRRLP